MNYTPLILSEVDLDRRLVHLANEPLLLPILHERGFVRRTLKAHVLPFVDTFELCKDGLHHNVHLTRNVAAALRYNLKPSKIDIVDVLAVYRNPSSKLHHDWELVLFDHLKVRDHPYQQSPSQIKNYLAYSHYVKRVSQHLALIESFLEDYNLEKHMTEFRRIEHTFYSNVALGLPRCRPATFKGTLRDTHGLLLMILADLDI